MYKTLWDNGIHPNDVSNLTFPQLYFLHAEQPTEAKQSYHEVLESWRALQKAKHEKPNENNT